jgi:hypothetical protein
LMVLYQKALANVELSGPTYFGQLIEESCKLAASFKQEGSNTYTTLLIITDGEIHDMDRTVDLIVQASNLPLSIIIVGVGNADFSNMSRLDGDNGLYSSKGVAATRDIVQFVPFRDVQMSGDLLAKELLAELPGQVVQYMSSIGKPPGAYVPLNVEELIKK